MTHDALCPAPHPDLIDTEICTFCQLIREAVKRERQRLWRDPMRDAYRDGYNDGVRCKIVGDWLFGGERSDG